MTYEVELTKRAVREARTAFLWYEDQQNGLGDRFLKTLFAFYVELGVNPLNHSYFKKNIRHGKLYKFPYVVVYEVFENKVVVLSVFMTRRNPKRKSP